MSKGLCVGCSNGRNLRRLRILRLCDPCLDKLMAAEELREQLQVLFDRAAEIGVFARPSVSIAENKLRDEELIKHVCGLLAPNVKNELNYLPPSLRNKFSAFPVGEIPCLLVSAPESRVNWPTAYSILSITQTRLEMWSIIRRTGREGYRTVDFVEWAKNTPSVNFFLVKDTHVSKSVLQYIFKENGLELKFKEDMNG